METQNSRFEEFGRRYAMLCLLREDLNRESRTDKANDVYDKLMRLFAEHEEESVEFRDVLARLVHHSEKAVALSAASDALWHLPVVATKRLEELAQDNSVAIGFTAEKVLEEWRAGRLRPWWRERWPKRK